MGLPENAYLDNAYIPMTMAGGLPWASNAILSYESTKADTTVFEQINDHLNIRNENFDIKFIYPKNTAVYSWRL